MKKSYLFIAAVLLTTTAFSQQRTTLIETFTSSTCGPCTGGNINLESILADAQNDDKQVSIKYQMSWPGTGDPYFTDEGDIRRDLYVVGGIPASRLDGTVEYNTGSLTQANLNTMYAVAPKANVTAYYTIDEASKTIDIQATIEVLENTPPGVRVFAAIFEYQTSNNVKSNGETEFFHVVKKMVPGASGVVMSPMTAGETYDFNQSYTFNGNYFLPANAGDPIDDAIEHSVEEFSDLGVAVWVQTISTREVYNAGYATLSTAGLNDNESTIPTAKIYPNPAIDEATIAFHTTTSQEVSIDVYDAMGKVVYSKNLGMIEAGRATHEIDITEFDTGIYNVVVNGTDGLITKRLSVQ